MALVSISEILKFLLPAIVLYFTVMLIVKAYLNNEEKKRENARSAGNSSTIIPLRLQAYERLALLLERITPAQAVNRVLQAGMTAYHLQVLLVQNIREEFEHNVAQQIYISPAGWAMIKTAKEETIRLVNTSAAEVDAGAPAGELAKIILEKWGAMNQNPVQNALDQLKAEVRQVF